MMREPLTSSRRKVLAVLTATGRCKASHDLTGAGQPLGTPAYMPPEQWLDSARADIRSTSGPGTCPGV
jgi:hypothetical protein